MQLFVQPLKALAAVARPIALAAVLCAASASAQAPLDIRVALVIGNSAYASSPLINPANDARAMSSTLTGLGFKVVELRDGSKAQMTQAIGQVSELLKSGKGVGMLYYAGHAMQLDWHNYMVPVDARLTSSADVAGQTVNLVTVIDAFKAAGNRMNIVVLDACRDNPFAGTASAKGLAPLDAPPGTFLAYATAPGNVADDGDNGNGLYTRFLLDELAKPTAKIEDVFKRVRLHVRQTSKGRQIPWESTSLEDDFYFNTGQKIAKPDERARQAAFEQEKAEWNRIKDTRDAAELFAFLQKYPRSDLAEAAQYRLDRIAKPEVRPMLGKDQGPSMAYTGERFRLGDDYRFVIKDSLTGLAVRDERLLVTGISDDIIEVNKGQILLTPLSAIAKTNLVTFDPPLASAPAEFQLGRRWENQSVQTDSQGRLTRIEGTVRVTGRETITLPAGTFETWVMESTLFLQPQFSQPAATNRVKLWIDPRYGIAVQRSDLVRNVHGVILRSEIRQLTSLKAERY